MGGFGYYRNECMHHKLIERVYTYSGALLTSSSSSLSEVCLRLATLLLVLNTSIELQ